MEPSEFTPPARLSLTDEQISQQLGSATADEAGMLAAMDFLEKQTALREQDNAANAAWIQKMQSSTDPRAAIALENLERIKQGQEPLPIPAEIVVSGSAEENVEAFEELLVDSNEPATLVAEDESSAEKAVSGYRMVSAANWILSTGVFAPVVAAVTANLLGMNFVTSVLAGLVGVLVGVKVNVLGLVTARRTHRGLAVATRATYGVFGAIVPGLLVILAALGTLAVLVFGAEKLFDSRIIGIPEHKTAILSLGTFANVSVGAVVAATLVLVAGVLAVFGGKFARVVKIALATAVLLGFLALAFATTPSISFLNLAGFFQLDAFLVGAPLFALLMSIFSYGADGESISIASWGASRKRLAWPIYIFGAILPMLVYAHVAALLNQKTFGDAQSAIDYLLQIGGPIFGSIMLYFAIISVIGLLYLGLMKVIEALKALGTNHVGYGSAILLILVFVLAVIAEAIFISDPLSVNFLATGVLLIPAAAWIGALLTETIMRRGKFHDASLTRGFGFYGSFNWVAFLGFVISCVIGFGFAEVNGSGKLLGFLVQLSGYSVSLTIAAFLSMGFAVLYTLATSFPRIRRQQYETKAVDERRFDLVDVVVD